MHNIFPLVFFFLATFLLSKLYCDVVGRCIKLYVSLLPIVYRTVLCMKNNNNVNWCCTRRKVVPVQNWMSVQMGKPFHKSPFKEVFVFVFFKIKSFVFNINNYFCKQRFECWFSGDWSQPEKRHVNRWLPPPFLLNQTIPSLFGLDHYAFFRFQTV